ncbi:MAG: LptF/LptG family permease [Kiritimatiellia bacterium]
MRTISRHIAGDFILALTASFVIFTFVISLGIVFKAVELLARGVSWGPVVRLAVSGMPDALRYSIPVSSLMASLLVFGRLSADSEITAMKACGLSLTQIAAWPVGIALWLACLCAWINGDLAPRSHFARKSMVSRLGVETAAEMVEAGRFIEDFPGLVLYVGRKTGSRLSDVRIYDFRDPDVKREIQAERGEISSTDNDIIIRMEDVRVEPLNPGAPGAGVCARWTLRVPDALQNRKYRPRVKDFSFSDLFRRIRDTDRYYPELKGQDLLEQSTRLAVEFNKRLALSAACFAFVLVGIPLGIKTHRRESSVGAGLSLLFVFGFYMFIILAEAMVDRPQVRPDLIVWAPVALCAGAGAFLLRRNR